MTFCIKIKRKDYNYVKKSIDVDNSYAPIFIGEFVLVPVKSTPNNFEIVECNPPKKQKTSKLRELIKGVSSYYVIGDIALVSPKVEVNKEKLAEAIMSINPNVKSVFLRKKVTGELRINELEHIGGVYKTKTYYKENHIKFSVDISKVYVNVSLANERLTLSRELKGYKKILDAFSSYGAIALNIAHKNESYVVAGDINIEGLYLAKESLSLNKFRGLVDLVQYDAHFLPFRDKSFEVAIGDNPTMIQEFLKELCRVSKISIIYLLSDTTKNFPSNTVKWYIVNEYSKNLFIYKLFISCNY